MGRGSFAAVTFLSLLCPLLANRVLAAPAAEKPAPAAFEPSENYATEAIEGWRVLVNKSFRREHAEVCQQTTRLLQIQLYQITRCVPEAALDKLRKIAIWVELAEPHHPCMAYHPDAGWLKEHGMNPEKARCVELSNAKNFLTWTIDQPWMVLHELAHGYHDQFLGGYDNADIRACYQHAVAEKLYDSVLRINNHSEPAYAKTNPMEYFAEQTEAYFGTNDFYPYVRCELEQHDPQMYELLGKLWRGEAKKK